ncbi:MAG: TonB-dependent receptor plug domain-containing protein, partial [Bacteroidota bacterium]
MKLLNPQTWGILLGIRLKLSIVSHLKIPILLLFSFNVLYAQDMATVSLEEIPQVSEIAKTITGTVTDSDGDPMIGATVRVKGSTVGTLTQDRGAYRIDAADDATLIFSFIGYETQEIPVNGRSTIDVVLLIEDEELDEVVIVGYGVQKKSDLTGSVASINGDDIRAVISGNPTSALQGKLPGIQVENNGGEPGGAANVFIRGVSSLTNSFPLYVIDGTFADNMVYVNPKDIERIEVLKDASAAAIYGSRAANGVIIVTTKRGQAGPPRVTLDMRAGIENAARTLDLLNGPEFVEYRRQRELNDATGFQLDPAIASYDTDWQDLSLNA